MPLVDLPAATTATLRLVMKGPMRWSSWDAQLLIRKKLSGNDRVSQDCPDLPLLLRKKWSSHGTAVREKMSL